MPTTQVALSLSLAITAASKEPFSLHVSFQRRGAGGSSASKAGAVDKIPIKYYLPVSPSHARCPERRERARAEGPAHYIILPPSPCNGLHNTSSNPASIFRRLMKVCNLQTFAFTIKCSGDSSSSRWLQNLKQTTGQEIRGNYHKTTIYIKKNKDTDC